MKIIFYEGESIIYSPEYEWLPISYIKDYPPILEEKEDTLKIFLSRDVKISTCFLGGFGELCDLSISLRLENSEFKMSLLILESNPRKKIKIAIEILRSLDKFFCFGLGHIKNICGIFSELDEMNYEIISKPGSSELQFLSPNKIIYSGESHFEVIVKKQKYFFRLSRDGETGVKKLLLVCGKYHDKERKIFSFGENEYLNFIMGIVSSRKLDAFI